MPSKNFYYSISLFFVSMYLSSCSTLQAIGEYKNKQVSKELEDKQIEYKKWEEWYDTYIKDKIYVDMPEEEFVKLFTKDASWNDPDRPYIIIHTHDKYVILGLENRKYRITFASGLLVKFEEYGWEKIPIITAGYRNNTFSLKGYEISNGLYKGMSEYKFLENDIMVSELPYSLLHI